MRACTSGGIPVPVSLTASTTCGPAVALGLAATKDASTSTSASPIVSRPPPGIASRAFTTRLSTTCSICAGSASTRPTPGATVVTSSTSSPISRCSIGSRSATTTSSARTRVCSTCLRLKARSWRVRVAARSPTRLISSTSLRTGSSARRRCSSRSLRPEMTGNRLLKSWAMPPASRPTASIFCDCRSSASRRRGSVTLAMAPIIRTGRPCSSCTTWPRSMTSAQEPSARRKRNSSPQVWAPPAMAAWMPSTTRA